MALNKMGNKDIDEAKMGGIAKLYVAQFILAFVTFCILGFALSEIGTVGVLNGATVGFFAWIGFYATAAIGSMLWEQKPLKLLLITSGGMLVNLVISGAIIAGWR